MDIRTPFTIPINSIRSNRIFNKKNPKKNVFYHGGHEEEPPNLCVL